MDQNPTNPQNSPNAEPTQGPIIRTMSKDIESLEKKPLTGPSQAAPAYEPPPEMPLGMAPPPMNGETTAGSAPMAFPGAGLPNPATIPPPNVPTTEMPGAEQPMTAIPQMPQPPAPPSMPSRATETVISEKALTDFAPPQPPKKDIKKLAIIAGVVGLVIVLGLAGWLLYPRFFPAATPTPLASHTPTSTPSPTTIPSATPIVFFATPPEATVVIPLTAETKNELMTAIKNADDEIANVGTIKVLDLRKDGISLTFTQFEALAAINIPPALKNLIGPEFKLFVNYHAQEGRKMGIVLHLTDPVAAKTALTAWETSMPEDMNDLFLGADTGTKTTFKDGSYRDVSNRYITFSKPPYSIDYALYQNLLVIATSRYSFSNAIDHMEGNVQP